MRRRFQRNAFPRGDTCHYTHAREELAQSPETTRTFDIRPSAAELRSGMLGGDPNDMRRKAYDQPTSVRQN